MSRKNTRTFVSIDEGVIADDTGAIGGRQIKNRWIIAIGKEIARPFNGAFEKALISDLGGAPEAGN